ncbi:MAG: serine/threonine-protein kinase, partial [Lachnospiraceae bacterium]|nr:serine/threonine-protein kinase [Lachnospiraceae bacterium]
MIEDRYRKYEPFFGKWRIRRELGKGSFGEVFEIYWDDGHGNYTTSALKIIHIPVEEELKLQMEEQPNIDAVRNFFSKQVDRIKEEIRILQKCKGHSNIVSYEDHMIVENVGPYGIGWDILVRMELLYPLSSRLFGREATQYDVVQMWSDIANALIYCEEQNIIHRDIKPANILISASGRYKLTDFGAARKSILAMEASTRVGTEKYMAPEVYKNQRYDKRADYYSLGCVVYYFLNKRRYVFQPPYPQEINSDDNEQAERKRIMGESIPRIKGVSKEINEVLLKSMAYRPENRYRSAVELYEAIQHILETQGNELRHKRLNVEDAKQPYKGQARETGFLNRRNSSKWAISITIASALLVTGIAGIIYGISLKNNESKIREVRRADSLPKELETEETGYQLILETEEQTEAETQEETE